MHDIVSAALGAVGGAFGQMDIPQSAHALAACVALYFGRRFEPSLRLALWLSCAAFFFSIGAAGFYFGRPGLPTLLLLAAPDPYLFRPVPGLIELTTADHIVQLFLSAIFSAAAAATVLDDVLAGRAAARARRARAAGAPAAVAPNAALTWLPPLALRPGERLGPLPRSTRRRRVLGGAGARAAAAASEAALAADAARRESAKSHRRLSRRFLTGRLFSGPARNDNVGA